MRARDIFILSDWVKSNRTSIIRDKQNRGQLCDAAAKDLEIKVSDAAMKAVLDENDIATKNLSKHQREVQLLEEGMASLRDVLVKVVTSSNVPEWLRKELLKAEDLDAEVKKVLMTEAPMSLV